MFVYNDGIDEELSMDIKDKKSKLQAANKGSASAPLIQIMNGIAFEDTDQGKKFDANFISMLAKEIDDYEYYV